MHFLPHSWKKKKNPDFNFTGTCSLMCSWWRSQITDFHMRTGTKPETCGSRRERSAFITGTCYMISLPGGDMWTRVSQRQICAGVCHLEWPPQCVSLMCRHDIEMIKQTGGYGESGLVIGATGGHRLLDEVELGCRKSVCISVLGPPVVKGVIKLKEYMNLKEFKISKHFQS